MEMERKLSNKNTETKIEFMERKQKCFFFSKAKKETEPRLSVEQEQKRNFLSLTNMEFLFTVALYGQSSRSNI
jgi:hypothetical protein